MTAFGILHDEKQIQFLSKNCTSIWKHMVTFNKNINLLQFLRNLRKRRRYWFDLLTQKAYTSFFFFFVLKGKKKTIHKMRVKSECRGWNIILNLQEGWMKRLKIEVQLLYLPPPVTSNKISYKFDTWISGLIGGGLFYKYISINNREVTS